MLRSCYREFPPTPALTPYVACYWSHSVVGGEKQSGPGHAVLPDGCIDLLFDNQSERLTVVGTMTTAFWPTSCGPKQFVGVRFKPGGATPFLRERADRFTDQVEPVAPILGKNSLELQEMLVSSTVTDRIPIVEAWLLEQLYKAGPVSQPVTWAANQMCNNPKLRISNLARELSMSRQQLRRVFLQNTGVTPKVFARIARLQQLIPTISRKPLCQAAQSSGYTDQAHMANEFRTLVGISPSAYLRRNQQ